jgi:hypothetical protein
MWDVLLLVERAQHGEPGSWLKQRLQVLERRSFVPPLLGNLA